MIELALLAHPEDAEREEGHQVDEQAGREREESTAEVVLAVYGSG